jgi:hypothetical protein
MEKRMDEAKLLPQVEPPTGLPEQVMAAIFAEPATSWEIALQRKERSTKATLVIWLVVSTALVFLTLLYLPKVPGYLVDQLLYGIRELTFTIGPWLSGIASIWRLFTGVITFLVSVAALVGRISAPFVTLWKLATSGALLSITMILGVITLIGQVSLIHLLTHHARE